MVTNKKIILGFLGIFFAITLISFVFAAGYCFKQLTNGESIPAEIVSTTKHMVCDGTKCTVRNLNNGGGGFLQVCTDSRGYYASFTKCSSVCETSGTGNDTPLTLTANFPFQDRGVFTKQSFFMDIHTNKIAIINLIDNIAGTQRNLCPNCMNYEKPVNFKQGFNDITIRAMKGTSFLEKRIRFFIDNRKPVISKTMPLGNKFASGNFTVFYSEDNVKKIQLYYGLKTAPSTVELTGCESGKTKACSINVDLTSFDGKEIYYWFALTDIADNMVQSKPVKVFVDKISPEITIFNYSVDKTNVAFNFKINEKNFDRIIYYDNNDPRAKILCTSLNKGACTKKMSFRKGHHDVLINVLDKAGNVASNSIGFDIA